jgi:hypothetical protein
MPPFNSLTSDPYCADPAKLTINIDNFNRDNIKYYDDPMEDFGDNGRPTLHHMPSISTTCTSDSFQSPYPSAESGEPSAFDLNASEAQDFEWTMNASHAFQWAPNRIIPPLRCIILIIDNLATPPLESPVGLHQLQSYTTQQDHHQIFSAPMPTPTDYYPVPHHDRRPSQPIITNFQTFTTTSATQVYQPPSSAENSQSTTPTILSPPLPRPTKKGSISTDIPTGRNRGQSLNSAETDTNVNPSRLREAMRRRASVSASQHHHHLSRSPNRSHQRRPSGKSQTLSPSFAIPISESQFAHDQDDVIKPTRQQVKRSKSANHIILKQEPQDMDAYAGVGVGVENDSSGEDAPTVRLDLDESTKTKQARALSEHRRREDIKQSFERLKGVLGIPQPRAGKRDLIEQAILALECNKRREEELVLEVRFLQSQLGQRYIPPRAPPRRRPALNYG